MAVDTTAHYRVISLAHPGQTLRVVDYSTCPPLTTWPGVNAQILGGKRIFVHECPGDCEMPEGHLYPAELHAMKWNAAIGDFQIVYKLRPKRATDRGLEKLDSTMFLFTPLTVAKNPPCPSPPAPCPEMLQPDIDLPLPPGNVLANVKKIAAVSKYKVVLKGRAAAIRG